MTTVTADQARECTAEEGKRWQERYTTGYVHGKSDTLNPHAVIRADLLIDVPAEIPGECGARYVARHLELAYAIGYTRAVAWYSAHPYGTAPLAALRAYNAAHEAIEAVEA